MYPQLDILRAFTIKFLPNKDSAWLTMVDFMELNLDIGLSSALNPEFFTPMYTLIWLNAVTKLF